MIILNQRIYYKAKKLIVNLQGIFNRHFKAKIKLLTVKKILINLT